ncbi:MAG: hypothetical protein HYZ40_00710 [Rhodospirillales bacterium]|nr:hypothetical protein [Rhodospirillales bacterium]
MSTESIPIGAIRRATPADAAAIAAFAPEVPAPELSDDRATFVIDDGSAPIALIDLVQRADHLQIEHLVGAAAGTREHARTLIAFAEAAARAVNIRKVRLAPGVLPDDFAASLGYANGLKTISTGALARARDHLEAVGVPLWRDGTASVAQTLYYRGIWAAIALLIGLGSVSLAVFSGTQTTLLHVVAPAVLCALASVFAIWQIGLVAAAGWRRAGGIVPLLAVVTAAASVLAIGALLYDRAVPALAEMWNIYTGDEELGDLALSVSPSGTTLHIDGTYGMGSDQAVRRALEQNPKIREVVLAGPGGRMGAGFEISRMIRSRRLATRVDTGCASACTIAFLGGVDRSIAPSAKLGFHRASFPGMSANDMFEANRDMKRFLTMNAGVAPDFAQRVLDTLGDSIWVPTPDELLAARVIKRVNR